MKKAKEPPLYEIPFFLYEWSGRKKKRVHFT